MKLDLYTLDFETFYDSKDKYSLRSKEMNTSSYVRDERFYAHCLAIKKNDGKTRVIPGPKIAAELKKIDWSKAALLCHNTAFDGFILSHHYGIVPAFYYDTVSMTRGLHNEVSRASLDTIASYYGIGSKHEGALENTNGKRNLTKEEYERLALYCENDNELCYQVFQKQAEIYPEAELRLIDLTIRMFCDPRLKVDIPTAEKALHEEMTERRRWIALSGQTEKVLASTPGFSKALNDLGVPTPMKISKTTGQPTPALSTTDEEFLALLDHEDRRVVLLVQGRLAAKSTLFETRAKRMIDAGINGLRLPVLLNYFGAKTGRWSGGNKLNMQNLPRLERDQNGTIIESGTGMLRLSVVAPKGQQIVVADSSQIEARTIAWLAGQENIVEAFRNKEDVYCKMASSIYGREITKKDKLERFIGKIAVLGLGYGMGATKFQTTLALGIMGPPVDLPLKECKRVVTLYRKRNDKIVQLWSLMENILVAMTLGKTGSLEIDDFTILEWEDTTVWLPNGMGLHYPKLRRTEQGFDYLANGKRKKIYGGLLVENVVQALARIIVGEQMLNVAALKNFNHFIALMTHDEIVSLVATAKAEKLLNKTLDLMRVAPEWCQGIPLDAEGGFDTRYSK